MNDNLRNTLVSKLENLPDETARQLLDYIEFLESKYHRSVRERTTFERLAENLEETLGATRISRAAAKGTAQVLDAAGNMMRGVVAAGQAVVEELQGASNTARQTDQADKSDATPTADAPQAEEKPASESGEQAPSAEERLTKD